MNPERFQQIETIYNDAIALERGDRGAFLDRACGDDSDLRREVESLLAYEQKAQSYMDTPALQMAAQSLAHQASGTLVDRMLGRYQLLSLVGRGGMGEVYCAVDSRLNRLVAVKVLPPYLAADGERVHRFEQEARAIGGLNHPHICTLHDVGNDDEVHYLVFEYLAGEPLSDHLAKGALPVREALDYAIQIADALVCAHEQGIIHLDLKPSNVMLMRSGVKLLDFGIAELHFPDASPSGSASGTNPARSFRTQGTLGYMAPEQVHGLGTDHRTDIFAFGGVVYEMFTGRRAFPRSRTTVKSELFPASPPMSSLQAGVPPELDSLVSRCLLNDPAERWQSVSLILSVLEEIRAAL